MPSEFSTRFALLAPLTLDNFRRAWEAAPFARYFLNTTLLVADDPGGAAGAGTLAAYAFARYEFRGKNVAFALVLVQLMIMPDILLVENYKTMAQLGLVDTLVAIGLPYFASAFAIFLLRQTFMGIPKELDEAARVEGASAMQILWRVYVPLARPVYTAFALVSVSFHWNNFLWPLIITNSVNARPLTVGPAGVLFGGPGRGLVDHHGRDADDVGAAAGRLPAVPAPVRAELHARGHQVAHETGDLEHPVVLRHRRRRQPGTDRACSAD